MVKFRSNQEEIESNMETGGEKIKSRADIKVDRIGYSVDTKERGNNSPQHGDKGKRKINAQVVRRHSPRIRNDTT